MAMAVDSRDPTRWGVMYAVGATSRERAVSTALARCRRNRRQWSVDGICRLFSIDDDRVWGPIVEAKDPGSTARTIVIDAPSEARSESLVDWLEVQGRAGAEASTSTRHDLVLAIDLSDSTLSSSGFDLDGDGENGRTSAAVLEGFGEGSDANILRRRLKDSDYEDSILRAEIRAAEALVDRLPLGSVRVAIIVFSETTEVISLLEDDRDDLRRALAAIDGHAVNHLRGTNFQAAIETGLSLLAPSTAVRSIVLLSDGVPTLPLGMAGGEEMALFAAASAARLGVEIHTYALESKPDTELGVYTEIARLTGGNFEKVLAPGDVIGRLRALDLVGVESISIVNESTQSRARAERLFPNGSFDAFVQLAIGVNNIRIKARLDDGRELEIHRVVEHRKPSSPEEQTRADAELAELRKRLSINKLETELWAESERLRRQRRRHLTLEVESP